MPKLLQLELDRTAKTPLAEQIRNGISNAIESGALASGAYASTASVRSGLLLLGIATASQRHLAASCDRLCAIIDRFT